MSRPAKVNEVFYCDPVGPLAALRPWFFERGDASVAAALRAGFGLIGLFNLWDFYPVMDLLFGRDGLYAAAGLGHANPIDPRNLLYLHDSMLALRCWFWGSAAALICVVLGFFSRVAVPLAYLSMVLFHERDPFMVFGADMVLATCGWWLLFLDCGRAYSMDRWMSAGRGKSPSRDCGIELWPVKAMQIQVALIYLATGLAKLGTELWRDGSAVYYAFQIKDCSSGIFSSILGHKTIVSFMTYGSLAVELAFPILVFLPSTRLLALCLGVSLHLGIDVFMAIRLFSLTMYWSYLSFLSPEEAKILLGLPGLIMRKFISLGGSRWQPDKS